MQSGKVGWIVGMVAALAWVMLVGVPSGHGQTLGELNTSMDMMDNLNGASTGPNISEGFNPVQRARDAAGVPAPGRAGGVPVLAMGAAPGGEKKDTGPKITVITGWRVYDSITNELLDDAVKKKLPEDQKKNYFDDGTHGDLVAGDGEYTKIEGEQREWLGQSTQRVKEHLVQALQVAEGYTPIQFFGNALMSVSRQEARPRKQGWSVAANPNGGPGYRLTERPVDKSVQIPKYRKAMGEKDAKVKNDWAFRFLQEYRKNKDSLTSPFYTIYIPLPPQPPAVAPPTDWVPFSDPTALIRSEQMKVQRLQQAQGMMEGGRGRGGRGGGGMVGGMGGGGGGGGMGGGGR